MRRNWRYQFQEHVWTPTTSHHTHSNHHQQQVSSEANDCGISRK